ncbi:MAG TPA: glycosyltransferase [Chryseosolibacter sp.]
MLILFVVFCAAVGIQIIFFVTFLSVLNRKRESKMKASFPVSVIVCAHDEEQNLRELLPQLLAQDYDTFEIVIVNDRSNDGTYDFLLEQTKLDPRVKMVTVESLPVHVNGKKYALTLGIKAASHEWILLTDADCRPASTKWIASMSSHFSDESHFVLGFSPYQATAGFLNKFIRFESLVTAIQYFSFAWLGNPYMGVGRNLAYRKSLFMEKKGFNTFLNVTGGDDDLFVNRHAKGETTFAELRPESQMLSIPEKSLRSFYRQKVRHLSVGKRYKLKHRILLGVFTTTWLIAWFTGVAVLALDFLTYWWVAPILLTRIILLMFTIKTTAKQAQLTFELWTVPILDFLYSIYYLSTGPVALLTKKIRWRN